MSNGLGFFVDLTLCTGCRGCQVACKQWKNLPAEVTRNTGSYQNPPDLSYNTIRLVRFSETVIDKKLQWLFFPEQCRHCYTAPCKAYTDSFHTESAILQDEKTGAVIFSDEMAKIPAQDVRESCPYDIPRGNKDGIGVSKCDMCYDRVSNGMKPACVLSCPTGTMNFGPMDEMLALAEKRLKVVRKTYPKAYLGDPDNVRVIYLFQADHNLYYQDKND